eukprot:347462-Chlamydomonas_euryale.AAC.1
MQLWPEGEAERNQGIGLEIDTRGLRPGGGNRRREWRWRGGQQGDGSRGAGRAVSPLAAGRELNKQQ